jgi:hypothetical protein
MNLRLLRFSAIMFTAVAMSASFAHLMELQAKMQYDKAEYVRLQRTLYWNFGRVGGMAEILALVTTGGLAWWIRKRRPRALPLTASAAVCLAAAHGAFWAFVAPANAAIASWPVDSIPPDWTQWRDRWEYTHAARAFLVTGALAALAASVLQETPNRAEGTE